MISDRKTMPRAAALDRLLPQVTAFPHLLFDQRRSAAIADSTADAAQHESESGERSASGGSGLAAAIERATIRHWLTAESIARPLCTRPWLEVQPPARAALLAGITQLLYMPREPTHAVVDDTVSWTRSRLQHGAAGMVNAVLRRVAGLRSGTTTRDACADWLERRDLLPLPNGHLLLLNESLLPADSVARLGVQTSHPHPLVARWHATRGMGIARHLALHGMMQMPLVVHDGCERNAGSDSSPLSDLPPHSCSGFFLHSQGGPELAHLLNDHPTLILQDPASAQAVLATRSLAPRRILDACAGRGTKSVQLALLHPNAEVWATDPDPVRLRALRTRAKGIANLRICELAELGPFPRHFDLLLLDVPCSNTGVLARRMEARYRFSDHAMAELVALQRAIATHHRGLIAERGQVLWSTCSLDPTENQEQARWLAQQWRGQVVQETEWLPRGSMGDTADLLTDGSYHAVIRLSS